MKLNIIIYTSSGNRSGGTRQALYLAEGMAERGHNALLFVPEDSCVPQLASRPELVRVFNKKRDWRGQIEAAMPASGPLAVHAFHNAAVKRAAWWGLFWRKRAVICAHRGVLYRPNNPLPYWSPGIDAFLVNSIACGKVLQKVGLPARRIRYVPNSVPDERVISLIPAGELRAELGIEPQAPVFLCIANDNPIKGLKELIQAFAALLRERQKNAPAPCLALVGVSQEPWMGLAQELGIAGSLRCLGRTEDVGSLLGMSQAFVLPSLSESMPNTLLEAVRAGLPCIGTQVGAVPDILGETAKEPACGLLVPPGDVAALAEAMRRLLQEEGLAAKLAAGARIRADAYRPEKRLDLVESIYLELMRARGLL